MYTNDNNYKRSKTVETDIYPPAKRQRSDEINVSTDTHFQCEYCSNSFASLSNLNQHVSSFHLKNSTWSCSKCNKVTKNKINNS